MGRIFSRMRSCAGSPAINAGDLNAVAGVDGVPEFDQRGEPFGRIVGGRIDIGAFEYQTPTDLNLLVDTLVDESDGDYSRGDLSLREAIELANASDYEGVVDTIRFDPALTAGGPATILLTHGELAITDSLTIDGPGADLLTIDASGNDPTPDVNNGDGSGMFRIDEGNADTLLDVSMSGLTLTGVDANGFNEAVIWSQENLTLSEVVIRDNYLVGIAAVFNRIGDLTISSSQFSTNEQIGGSEVGLITVMDGNLAVVDTTLNYNSINSVFRIDHGSATLERTGIDDNLLTTHRSAVDGRGANLSFVDSSIRNNQGGSGIIATSGSVFRFIGSTISNNNGYGVSLSDIDGGDIAFHQTDVSGNSGTGIRLGDFFGINGSVEIVDCNVDGNGKMFFRGGGIDAALDSGSISIRDSVISGNLNRLPILSQAIGMLADYRLI